jgi:hypothetical protein
MLEPNYTGYTTYTGKKHAIGVGPADETTINSVIGDLVTSMLCMGWRYYGDSGEGLARSHYSIAHGIYNLKDERWHWEGISEAREWANQCSGGVSAVSAADGFFYNVSYTWVQCHGGAR